MLQGCSSARLSSTLGRQERTFLSFRSPILAGIPLIDDVEHVLKVHIWHAVEPVHQALNVWPTADFESHLIEETTEELFHFVWATEASGGQEAFCIE